MRERETPSPGSRPSGGHAPSPRLLPFRWLSARNAVKDLDAEVAGWLEGAAHLSVDNLPRLPGTTVIACDNSGSMDAFASGHSSVRLKDIAALLGAAAHRGCERSAVYAFATEAVPVSFRSEGVLERAGEVAGTEVGGATYAYKVPFSSLDPFDEDTKTTTRRHAGPGFDPKSLRLPG